MSHRHNLSRPLATVGSLVLAATVLAATGCGDEERLGPSGPEQLEPVVASEGAAASGTATGITFGTFGMETYLLDSIHNGTKRSPSPSGILKLVRGVQAKGGRIIVQLTDPDDYTTDGKFSLSKWKSELAKFRGVNLSPYIADGTIIGHYMIDEPDDADNWNGERVPPSALEEMAAFSKSIFPNMATIVRANPGYLINAVYVDAAWSQYTARRGDALQWVTAEATKARNRGLGLVVSLNVLDGGNGSSGLTGTSSGKYKMSAAELRKYGAAMISEPLACAFYMWKYSSSYYNRSDIKSAMRDLSNLAKAHPSQSCSN